MRGCPRRPIFQRSESFERLSRWVLMRNISILARFGNLRWSPSKPEHLDFVNAQILLIGRTDFDKPTEARDKEQEKGKVSKEALEDLEEDDLERMQILGDDDSEAIFADLHLRAEDYPKLQTTF